MLSPFAAALIILSVSVYDQKNCKVEGKRECLYSVEKCAKTLVYDNTVPLNSTF